MKRPLFLQSLQIVVDAGQAFSLLYPSQTKFFGLYRNHPVRPSIFLVSTTSPRRLWMKLYIAVVYDLRLCMKVDKHGPKNIKRDHNTLCKTGVSL